MAGIWEGGNGFPVKCAPAFLGMLHQFIFSYFRVLGDLVVKFTSILGLTGEDISGLVFLGISDRFLGI